MALAMALFGPWPDCLCTWQRSSVIAIGGWTVARGVAADIIIFTTKRGGLSSPSTTRPGRSLTS
jgi:hypothetical protein